MKHKWLKASLVSMTALSLLASAATVYPISTSSAAAAQKTLAGQVVSLKGTGSVRVTNAQFLMQESGKVLAFTVAYTNNKSTSLDLSDYMVRLKTKTGRVFKTQTTEADKLKTTVSSKSTQYITYYATVDNATSLDALQFQIVTWDFSASNYERTLGVISVPSGTSNQVAAFKGYTMMYNNNKLKGAVKQASMTKDQSNAYVTIQFLLENQSLQSIDLSKMTFNLQTQNMSSYTVTTTDLATSSIQPKERKIITLRSTIPLTVANKPLNLVISQNDETAKVKLAAGTFKLPATMTSAAVGAGKAQTVYLSGNSVKTSAGQAFLTSGAESNSLAMEFSLTNTGVSAVSGPNLEYYFRSKSGAMYPLTYTKEENGSLLPNIEKKVALSGSLPTSLSLDSSQLVVKTAATEKEASYVLSVYNLQSSTQSGGVGAAFKYGDYSVKLNSVQRFPQSNNDVLVANLSISNQGTNSKSVPPLSGYFMINGVKVGIENKLSGMDQSVTIGTGQSYDAVVYSEIPYSTAIDEITFVLTEPLEENKPGKQLYQFKSQNLSPIRSTSSIEPYLITNAGRKATVNMVRSGIFEGDTSNTFYAEFSVTNDESRANAIAALGGYIQDKNDTVVPVKFTEVKERITANGKVLVSAWANISKRFDASQPYEFVLGQAVSTKPNPDSGNNPNGQSGSGNEGALEETKSILVKPISYQLASKGIEEAQSSLKEIKFGGYTLDLQRVKAYLNVEGIYDVKGLSISADYTLTRDEQYEAIAGDHKVLFEFVNGDSMQTKYSKQYAIGTAGKDEEVLKETAGVNNQIVLNMDDASIQRKLNKYEGYTLNIYDVFQNSKLLVASVPLKWFEESK
ncbi:hypothetical protein SAMN05444162_2758 [Paenibacillaceae bacterium GAS479]|nr:hypothetical protein SAMN05444162_2758 [Paenibacillaceae bacterium GAS479]